MSDPITEYRRRLAAGELRPDPCQNHAAERLQSLYLALRDYSPKGGRRRFLRRFSIGSGAAEAARPRGLYLFGDVGRGKSMLMDLFYAHMPIRARKRVHFHAFMQEMQARLHELRPRLKAQNSKQGAVEVLAQELAREGWLLCFDEFQVTDIADALILSRLFTALFKAGVIVVATSNTAPQDLYAGGLQRDLFLPFIDLMQQNMDVVALEGGTDYRRARLQNMQAWYFPPDARARAALDQIFALLSDHAKGQPEEIRQGKRCLAIPLQARGVARFHYKDLIKAPLGAADYLRIADHFHSVILDEMPQLTPEMRNEARRFIWLIDALYERRTRFFMSCAVDPEHLCPEGRHRNEYQRSLSRLHEMASTDYLDVPDRSLS